ncbi:hypothetical protein IW261DRAFT_1421841 [Armillaria novae-zelandiae]|uniref:Uncharacterized protein n=1 Tax=Armillaria novae-zelandiae TaxID=153914 RepID=A0AA39P2E2_9AGAR|nr:hypothetical protein IW261DRAFT_1421841 [Armillaria novae-zelandiae]
MASITFIDLYLIFVICVSMPINYYHLIRCLGLQEGGCAVPTCWPLRQLSQRSLHPAWVQPYQLAGDNDQDGGGECRGGLHVWASQLVQIAEKGTWGASGRTGGQVLLQGGGSCRSDLGREYKDIESEWPCKLKGDADGALENASLLQEDWTRDSGG